MTQKLLLFFEFFPPQRGAQISCRPFVVSVFFVFVGGIAELEAICAFGDAALGIMTFPNLISIILLTGALM